ncbi:ISAs1 family transposase [Hymenobacter rubripertinctus]|uniref:ISAs1 family transposase n=1 Tax=Hymenobacter rubripertinctus TaxID=2029981 RepID=A0A418QGT4_9BACT|nr:ISAs1 family transposase [Hymenobacter rubripertinctus]
MVDLPSVPSHDTFNRVFQLLSPALLQDCLAQHGHALLDTLAQKQLCLDGKKLRGVSPRSADNAGLYLVNAWVSENRLCVGQQRVADKSNEITALPELLAQLDLREAVVTIDAMGCQAAIAGQIRQQQGHYLWLSSATRASCGKK